MNKADLISQVAIVVSTKKETEAVFDTVFGAISQALKEGDRVILTGFGTFSLVDKPLDKPNQWLAGVPQPFLLLCAEKRVADCQRRLIAEYLVEKKGAEVEHIE
jgi:hypothetical protein